MSILLLKYLIKTSTKTKLFKINMFLVEFILKLITRTIKSAQQNIMKAR